MGGGTCCNCDTDGNPNELRQPREVIHMPFTLHNHTTTERERNEHLMRVSLEQMRRFKKARCMNFVLRKPTSELVVFFVSFEKKTDVVVW